MGRSTTTPPPGDGPPRAEQPSLLDDLDHREPVPFSLTARARRVVAPAAVPDLAVVPGGAARITSGHRAAPSGEVAARSANAASSVVQPGERRVPAAPQPTHDPHDDDALRARVRALFRAGIGVPAIVRSLGVPAATVADWVDAIDEQPTAAPTGPALRASGARQGQRSADDLAAEVQELPGWAFVEGSPRGFSEPTAFLTARVAARTRSSEWAEHHDAVLRTLVVAVATVTPWAVILRSGDPAVVAAALQGLRSVGIAEPDRIRVHVRVARGQAPDLAAAAVAARLGLSEAQVGHSRWNSPPSGVTMDVRVRIPDPSLAGQVAAWREAVLGDDDSSRRAVG